MSNIGRRFGGGYYNENGFWVRSKFCFVSCGARCTCRPPGGRNYSPAHDLRKQHAVPVEEDRDF